jgi:hypothetical protein
MRLVLAMVLAALLASPLSVSAQDGEEGAGAKSTRPGLAFIPEHLKQRLPQHRHKPVPSAEPAPEEPALQLKLDEAGIQVMESPPPTVDRYPQQIQVTDERMNPGVKRARIGFLVSTVVLGAGVVLLMVAAGGALSTGIVQPIEDTSGDWVDPVLIAAGGVMGAGVVGMVTAGGILRHRKRELRRLQEAHYGGPRRVQWDLARSRLVF